MPFKFWQLPVHIDERGGLCAAEWKALPFKPKRAYFLFDTKMKRGGHAHRAEKEVFICVSGAFRATVHDGATRRSYIMNTPGQALYTANMIWHEFDRFSSGAVMLALSSTPYKGQKGYIMDFERFKQICKKKSLLQAAPVL